MEMIKLLQELLPLLVDLSQPLLALIGVFVAWKYSGKVDLDKTLEAVKDIKDVAEEHEVVEKVEELRGKKIPEKLKKKAIARYKALKK